MIMTVRQAERKICPYQSGETSKKCTASECPLWRWANPDLLILEKDMPPDIKAGYCGAGGRPEVYKLEEF